MKTSGPSFSGALFSLHCEVGLDGATGISSRSQWLFGNSRSLSHPTAPKERMRCGISFFSSAKQFTACHLQHHRVFQCRAKCSPPFETSKSSFDTYGQPKLISHPPPGVHCIRYLSSRSTSIHCRGSAMTNPEK